MSTHSPRRKHGQSRSLPEGRGDALPEREVRGPRSALPEGRGEVPIPDDFDDDVGEASSFGPEALPVAENQIAPREATQREGIRVHKAMAQAGVASRREAERMVAEGQVRINGREVVQPGTLLVPGDALEVAGRIVHWEKAGIHELWALYKPKRCVCTLNDPQGRRTVKDFFPRTEQRLFPIGRLDYDAEGLLLLTNDGALAQRVTHPSYGMPRVYLVKVKGTVEAETILKLGKGMVLEGELRQPARTRVLHTVNDKTWLEVVLREGIHHHLKKMFLAVGHPVLKIKRYQIGPIELGDLQPGRARKLGRADIDKLMHWSKSGRDGKTGQSGGKSANHESKHTGTFGADDVPLLRLPAKELTA